MVMRVMEINDVESLLINITRDTPDVGYDVLQTNYVMRFGNRCEMKDIDALKGLLFHTLCHTLRSRDRRTPIGQRYLVPPLLEGQAEIHHRLCRACPLPIGEEVEDLHDSFNPTLSARNPAYFNKKVVHLRFIISD